MLSTDRVIRLLSIGLLGVGVAIFSFGIGIRRDVQYSRDFFYGAWYVLISIILINIFTYICMSTVGGLGSVLLLLLYRVFLQKTTVE